MWNRCSFRHKPGFIKHSLLEYVPHPYFDKHTPEEWEEQLFRKHADLETTTPMEDYIAFLSSRDYYGCTFFGVKQKFNRKFPKTLLLGVNARGVILLKPADLVETFEMEALAVHPLSDIYRWAYKPGVNFYFEMKPESEGEENPVYTFLTVEVSCSQGGRSYICEHSTVPCRVLCICRVNT